MGGFPASEVIAALIAQLPGPQVDRGPWHPDESRTLWGPAQERIDFIGKALRTCSVNG